jgi:heptosyltransferase I
VKILILKPSSLGDVIQALPVLRMLKLHYPAASIYWWIETASEPLLERDPDLAGVIRFDRKRWAKPRHVGEVWRCIREIRAHRFDLVIDLQALARSGTIAWLGNGAFTVGLQDWREFTVGFYDVAVPRPSPQTHAVDWYLETLKPLRVPVRWDFEWLPKRADVAEELARTWSFDGRPLIALQPGARWTNKRWPVEYFSKTVRLLRAQERTKDARFLVLGGNADRELGQAIAAAAPDAVLDLTGRTNLADVIELIRASCVMITNDTGPMHIGAALRKPVVGIFGPTNPARTGPYGQVDLGVQRRDIYCVPCLKDTCRNPDYLACLHGITPSRIATEVIARLAP